MSTPCAERNLIYGLLALQMDFVTREQLLDAMHAWMLHKTTPLAQILRQSGALNERRSALLEDLLEEHLARHGGDPRSSLAVLRDPASAHPAVWQDLARLADADVEASLSTLQPRMPDAALTAALPPRPAPSTEAAATIRANGLRFRRLREHAKGGLGEVFVALDEELNREVALKEIQERFADLDDVRTRFLREAEITGKLEHPGVVPVYGLGTYPDGRPFYAMRFIRGESMEEAINRFHQADEDPGRDPSERSLALRELLGRFVAVCNAVAFAHSRAVIHRDIKPANAMLGEYGETLVVDWGLARVLDRFDGEHPTAVRPLSSSPGTGSTPTEMGQVVGTPAFMPPEQAAGRLDEVGIASDIFALGATLYCLLTGQAPYCGSHAVIQAALAEHVPARQRKRSVPAALEAVCARAMAATPADRYHTAQALAEDVQRWLADEPVQVYREPLADRLRRWGRRNRSVVSAGAVLLLAGVVGLSVGLWAVGREQARTARALTEAEENLGRAVTAEEEAKANLAQAQANLARAQAAEDRAKANLARSEDNLKLARRAIDECFNVARDDPLFQEPRMEKAKKLLMEKTLPFYKQLRSQRPDDPRLRREEAEQHFRVGYIEHALGHPQVALLAYGQAREECVRLTKDHPGEAVYQNDLATTLQSIAIQLAALGKHTEALETYQQARSIQLALTKANPSLLPLQHDLAGKLHSLANAQVKLGRSKEALKTFQQARDICLKLEKERPGTSADQEALGHTYHSMAVVLGDLGKPVEALKVLRQARVIRVKLAATYPETSTYQYELALTMQNLGLLLSSLGKGPEALQEMQRALDIQARLAKANPDLPQYQHFLARMHHGMGNLLSKLNRREEARKEHEQARSLRVKLVRDYPDLPEYQHDLAGSHNSMANLQRKLGKNAEALEQYRHALDIHVGLARAHPETPGYQYDLALTQNNLGLLLAALGKPAEALEQYQQARAVSLKLVKAHAEMHEYQSELARTQSNVGRMLARLGKPAEALREQQEARDRQTALAVAQPEVASYQHDLMLMHLHLARLLASTSDRRQQAVAEYQQGVNVGVRLAGAHPEVARYQDDLGGAHTNLGVLLSRLGRLSEAAKDEKARDVRIKLAKDHPGVPRYRAALSSALADRADMLFRQGKHEDSMMEFRQARDVCRELAKSYPESLEYQSDLVRIHNNLGLRLAGARKREEALKEYMQARDAGEKLVKVEPEEPEHRINLAATCCNLGNLVRDSGKAQESLDHYARAIALLEAVCRQVPGNATARAFLRNSRHGRVPALMRLGRHGEADADWEALLKLAPVAQRPGVRLDRADSRARGGDYLRSAAEADELARDTNGGKPLYDLACIHALNAASAARNVARPLPEREKRAEQYARTAVELLRRAAASGLFRDPAKVVEMDRDADLELLRQREDWKRFRGGLKPGK